MKEGGKEGKKRCGEGGRRERRKKKRVRERELRKDGRIAFQITGEVFVKL